MSYSKLGPHSWEQILPGVASDPSIGTLYPEFTTSGTGPFTVGIQVTDATTLIAVAGRYWVRVMIGTTEWAQDATGGITYNTLTTYNEYTDGLTDILTDSTGFCEIEISPSADRYVTAAVGMERAYSSGLLEYSVSVPPTTGNPIGLLLALTYA